MKVYKVKIKDTEIKGMHEVPFQYGVGYAVRIENMFYGSKSPQHHLHLFDGDKDEFVYPIPGQAIPKPTSPEVPITVKLPIYYLDTEGENELMLWGEVFKIDVSLDSSF